MRIIAAMVLGTVASLSAGGRPIEIARSPSALHRVRAASPLAQTVIDEARRRSATVRTLIEELSALDVFVYVELRFDPPVSHGTTRLIAASEHGRYLRVALDVMLSPPDRLSVLAHELQHALEVAREPAVRDEATLRGLYERIGWAVGAASFETQAAIDTERRARLDLYRKARPDHV